MNPPDYLIFELIPHQAPMVMIDQLTFSSGDKAGGILFIRDTNIFCINGFFQEAGLIEFISQTAAAHKGFLNLYEGKEIKLGYISVIKNMTVHSLPTVNTEIRSEITVENELLGHTIISGEIYLDNSVIASGEIRFITDAKE
jgi:predicted hotdog family 3-hydroxylacyl-ACP dehydratase